MISTNLDEDQLNSLGKNGWELVNIAIDNTKAYDKIYVFKRKYLMSKLILKYYLKWGYYDNKRSNDRSI